MSHSDPDIQSQIDRQLLAEHHDHQQTNPGLPSLEHLKYSEPSHENATQPFRFEDLPSLPEEQIQCLGRRAVE
ncbi:MAG: hypothetical protein Q9181_007346 [Wetmoreana brouardii]